MKKKLTLTFLIMLFAVLLAVGVSATTIYKDSDGNTMFSYEVNSSGVITSYNGNFPKTDSEGSALTWYVVSTATEGDNTVKTVASVLSTDETYFTISSGTYSYKGKTVTQYNVVSVNLQTDKTITKLSLANAGYRQSNTYSYTPGATEILFVYLPSTLTELPERIGQGSKMLACEMPSDMPITKISHVAFHQAKCLRVINVPSTVTEIAGKSANDGAAFYMCDSLEAVTFGENSVLVTIGNYVFHKNISLREVKIPNSVKTIGSHAFSYTAIVDSPFDKGSLCETLGGRAFSDNTSLKTFIVPAGLKSVTILGSSDYGPLSDCTGIELVTFGDACPITTLLPSFFGRATIDKIILPEGPTTIPNRYFISATLKDVTFSNTIETAAERVFTSAKVEVIRLGANFKYFENSKADNHSFTNALCEGLKAVYIPASFYAEKPDVVYQVSHAFEFGSLSNIKFFYTGTQEQLAISIDNFKNGTTGSGTNNWKFIGATQISYEAYSANPDNYANGNYIVFGYDPCLAFCAPFYDENAQPEATIVYESYLESGVKTTICPICKGYNEGQSVAPLFTCLGYSVGENGLSGISICFVMNEDAIMEYEKATGKTLSFGVFAASYAKLGNNEAVNADGTLSNYVLGAAINRQQFSAFEMKVVGFTTEAQMNARLALGVYALVTKDGATSVKYVQAGKALDGEKYHYITYNTAK